MTTDRTSRLRKKLRIAPIKSREELATLAIATADLTIERDKTAATRDERIAQVADGYNVALDQLNEEIAGNIKRLRHWAIANRDAAFEGRQSIEVAGHELRFRRGSGKVAYAPGVKAGDALESILAADDEAKVEQFAKVSAALDKNAILRAWRESAESRAFLESIGIRVLIEEDFQFIPARKDAPALNSGEKQQVAE